MQRGQSGQYPLCGRRRDGERRSTLSKSREEFSMPIRFRCAYCNQLLGIARRKVGTVVRCPTCAGQVVVPDKDAEDLDKIDDPANPPLFERDDFDALFEMPAAIGSARGPAPRPQAPAAAAEPAGSWGTHAE